MSRRKKRKIISEEPIVDDFVIKIRKSIEKGQRRNEILKKVLNRLKEDTEKKVKI